VLLVRSYSAILRVDPGFNSAGVLTARLSLDQSRYPDAAAAIAVEEKYAARFAAIPGVTASGATSSPPLLGDTDQGGVRPVGVVRPTDEAIISDIIRSTPGYLRAMGITLLAGRDFTRADRENAAPVAIVDERFARTAWSDGGAVGRQITIDGGKPVTVVGLVRHARQYHIERDDREQVYRPFAQDAVGTLFVTLRGNQDPVRLIAPLRAAVADVDPKQPLADVHAVGDAVTEALSARRLQLTVLGSFAAGAALLAAFGVYGILASIVASRTREIGIRIALGASGSLVRALVLRDVFVLAGTGTAVGLASAFAGSKLLAHLLFAVSPHDPMSFGITAVALMAAAAAAAYLPARRASRVDPAVALRADT
jgi:predicted permease